MPEHSFSVADMLADSARGYVARFYSFDQRNARIGADVGTNAQPWREFAEMGWLSCLIDEEEGGLGGGAAEMAALQEVFGKALLVEPFLSSAVLATRLIAATEGSAGRNDLLARLANGSLQVAVAHGERGESGEIAAPATLVQPLEAGGFTLRGTKYAVLGAPSASLLLVSARIDGADGDATALFAVSPDADGVRVHGYDAIDGAGMADIEFDGVSLGQDAMLAAPGRASTALGVALDWAAMAACAQMVGAIDEVVELSAEYARTRKQFDAPIGSFQSIKHLLADMATEAQLARAMLKRGLAALEDTNADTRRGGVSATKNYVSRAAAFVTGNGIQVHGGIGMTEEFIIGHYYKRCLVLSELFGNADYHRKRYAALRDSTSPASSDAGSGQFELESTNSHAV